MVLPVLALKCHEKDIQVRFQIGTKVFSQREMHFCFKTLPMFFGIHMNQEVNTIVLAQFMFNLGTWP
jgi:hypothetical protein